MSSEQNGTRGLAPRYRQPQTFSTILDETIRMYREHWLKLLAISAVGLIPGRGLYIAAFAPFYAAIAPGLTPPQAATLNPAAVLGPVIAGLVVGVIVLVLFSLAWIGAVSVAAEGFARGQDPSLKDAYLAVIL